MIRLYGQTVTPTAANLPMIVHFKIWRHSCMMLCSFMAFSWQRTTHNPWTSVSGLYVAHSRCLLICLWRVELYSSGRGRPLEQGKYRMINHCEVQHNFPAVDSLARRGFSTMGRTIHLHLSSCGQTPKFLDIPVAKRVQSIFSLPRIKCCFRTEKLSHSNKRKLSPSTSSWSYFEVYGNGHGFLSTSGGTVCKTPYEQTLHQAGSSRVLAAWKKIQSWSSVKPKNEVIIHESPTSVQSSATRNDHSCGQATATRRIKVSKLLSLLVTLWHWILAHLRSFTSLCNIPAARSAANFYKGQSAISGFFWTYVEHFSFLLALFSYNA